MENRFIFCVDSDGCVMDTMTYKHELFFGPLVIQFFDIENQQHFQKTWERINLYSKTRGVNRFTGLVMALKAYKVKHIDRLITWVETTASLSNDSLVKEITQHPSEDLKKALEWSYAVNEHIKSYQGEVSSFPMAKEGLKKLAQLGEVYVVSSANREAVEKEWHELGLLDYVSAIYCQDFGKKEDVIAQLLTKVDSPKQIVMIGDSPGDCVAAEKNNVFFYPILVGSEQESWDRLIKQEADNMIHYQYDETLYKAQFWRNLDN